MNLYEFQLILCTLFLERLSPEEVKGILSSSGRESFKLL